MRHRRNKRNRRDAVDSFICGEKAATDLSSGTQNFFNYMEDSPSIVPPFNYFQFIDFPITSAIRRYSFPPERKLSLSLSLSPTFFVIDNSRKEKTKIRDYWKLVVYTSFYKILSQRTTRGEKDRSSSEERRVCREFNYVANALARNFDNNSRDRLISSAMGLRVSWPAPPTPSP